MAKAETVRVDEALAALKKLSSKKTRDGMARFGIPSDNAWGVAMADVQKLGKRLGRDQALAEALFDSGVYEAQLLAAFVAEPERLTAARMNAWCRSFDNWALCDTFCFHLFDKSPHGFALAKKWVARRAEFEKRTGFALVACLALHHKAASDTAFLAFLPALRKGASDERHLVRKAVVWALGSIAHRKSAALKKAVLETATSLGGSELAHERALGKELLRKLGQRGAR